MTESGEDANANLEAFRIRRPASLHPSGPRANLNQLTVALSLTYDMILRPQTAFSRGANLNRLILLLCGGWPWKRRVENGPYNRPINELVLALAVLLLALTAARAQTGGIVPAVYVDVTPGHVLNAFDPDRALGSSIDVLSRNEMDKDYTPHIIEGRFRRAVDFHGVERP